MSNAARSRRSTVALLEKLGLSHAEASCYLAALQLEAPTVRELATAATIHRVHAYSAIQALRERGLLEWEGGGRARRVHAAPLARLEELAHESQKRATRLRWNIAELIPELARTRAAGTRSPSEAIGDVLYFLGDDVFYRISERTLQVPVGSTNCYIEFSNYFHPPENPGYDDDYYIPKRLERQIAARVLYIGHDAYATRLAATDAQELRTTQFLPPDTSFPCSVYLYGDEAALIWTTTETFGLVLRGGPLVSIMRLMFEVLWRESARTHAHGSGESRSPTHRSTVHTGAE
ncbi:hypothetical protein HYV74_04885 [Candidatus Uhrbacteria bacterium]|nr:hypothetical protein [Candidatus Uhrbacteria bacterium]